MRVGSLFSGIGGFDLGLERAGMQVRWQCEIDEFCRGVLTKHWPGVPCYRDIRELNGATVQPVDVLCGGFPCQDISSAGKGAGITGSSSGLWFEYARLIRELRPRYVVVENVPMLRSRGLDRVLGTLAACGYDAEWDGIPARALGAPHQRDRIWIVAYPHDAEGACTPQRLALAHPERERLEGQQHGSTGQPELAEPRIGGRDVAYAPRRGRGAGPDVALSESQGRTGPTDCGWWATEPDVGRVAHGIPARMDRLRGLGNALIPQIAEWIGQRILAYEAQQHLDEAA
jgi:DNA (cytosine-5)-methyltransferase 1